MGLGRESLGADRCLSLTGLLALLENTPVPRLLGAMGVGGAGVGQGWWTRRGRGHGRRCLAWGRAGLRSGPGISRGTVTAADCGFLHVGRSQAFFLCQQNSKAGLIFQVSRPVFQTSFRPPPYLAGLSSWPRLGYGSRRNPWHLVPVPGGSLLPRARLTGTHPNLAPWSSVCTELVGGRAPARGAW